MKLNEIRYGEHFQCRIEPYSDKSLSILKAKDGKRVSVGQVVLNLTQIILRIS